jgi:hypothetical protein
MIDVVENKYSMYQKFPESELNNDLTAPDRLTLRKGSTD